MERHTVCITGIVFVICFCFVFVNQAQAYIDPATGSYLLQMLIAGLLGAMFSLKIFWKKIRVFMTALISGSRNHGTPKK